MTPETKAMLDSEVSAIIAARTPEQQVHAEQHGRYAQYGREQFPTMTGGELWGSATEYAGPEGIGVEARFEFIQDGVCWLHVQNFGPETYRQDGYWNGSNRVWIPQTGGLT